MKRKYKTLLFDLDDTLLDYTADEKRSIEKVLNRHGIPVNADVFELYYSIDDWQHFTLGNISPKTIVTDHFMRMLKILQVESAETEIMGEEFYLWMVSSHRVKYGARKVLSYLRERGYKVYITSNGFTEIQRKRITDSGLENMVDDVFISQEIDLRKPGKAFFNYVFNHIPESSTKNMLIIGDAPTSDILGGLNSGIDTCWLDDKSKKCKYKYTYRIKTLSQLINIL